MINIGIKDYVYIMLLFIFSYFTHSQSTKEIILIQKLSLCTNFFKIMKCKWSNYQINVFLDRLLLTAMGKYCKCVM